MRYLITFSYDGSKFHGFQRQKDKKNIQGSLEKVLSEVLGENIVIKGSGRTDAGVHAYNQCAHFDTNKKINKKIIREVNNVLNNEIIVKKYRIVNDDFHARYNVKKKIYVYKMNIGDYQKALDGYCYQQKMNLDIKKMREAAKLLEGTHDYQNFVSGIRDDYVSTIYKIKIDKRNNIINFTFTGIGFYRYMVRHLVGALLAVGKCKVTLDDIENMLNKPREKKQLVVVPAEGLYLKNVIY